VNNKGHHARWRHRASKSAVLAVIFLVFFGALALLLRELESSRLQARHFVRQAQELHFRVEPGAASAIRFPGAGPFDERLGYSRLPAFLERLAPLGFELEAQARFSPALLELTDRGLFPPYPEKTRAGLTVLDCAGEPLFAARYPEQGYPAFESIPRLVVDTLLFIENRELLDPKRPHLNPAVDWGRLGLAVASRAAKVVDPHRDAPGGSTLATQMEKYRHSPEGITRSPREKLQQMLSASLRAYREGDVTLPARRRIVLDYLNTVPLAAAPGYGEVHGLADGLRVWFGADFLQVNARLGSAAAHPDQLAQQGRAFRQVLALIIAQRRPSHLLGPGRGQLERLTDSYLRVLAEAGVISPALRDAALAARLSFREDASPPAPAGSEPGKAASVVRVRLAILLDTPLYTLDRLDLSAQSTLDRGLQEAMTAALHGLNDPARARAAGLMEPRLLARGDPRRVLYSLTLYERSGGFNRVRVQTDNFDQPLDINEGTKLELGSTAKLRTLATYLEIVAALHQRYGELGPRELREAAVDPQDPLTRWAVDYLTSARDKSLPAMLEAALERRYSASPAETFFTGGGLHSFGNFKREDDDKVPTVRQAFRESVNLAFVRLMRDIVHHYMYQAPGSSASLLRDASHPRREDYLARFADREGRVFLQRFYRKYEGRTPEEALELLLEGSRPTPERLAVVFRSLEPEAGRDAFQAFLAGRLPAPPPEQVVTRLYERHAPGRYSLADQGFLARVHPLELWLAAYLRAHPQASLAQVMEASAEERRAVYAWLFNARDKNVQDNRIQTLLEMEAFLEIHKQWKRLGYPFEYLVPSYATALGSSGDRPAALAELMGIIVNDGLRLPTARIEGLHFAAGTPYETVVRHRNAAPERVMAPEVAAVLREELAGVVEAGTARRLAGAFAYEDGMRLKVGGKTGTGDNRFETHRRDGQVVASRPINRTATFAFFLGERHFGTLTAFVPGAGAGDYRFTSALPVQILKTLAPQLKPYLDPRGERRCTRGERVTLVEAGEITGAGEVR
jgi:membrane peptidoglycan carboxypeptidase